MKQIRNLIICMMSLLLVLSGTLTVHAADENEAFEQYLQEEFVRSNERDYLSMHYEVKDYQAYGIKKPPLTIGDVSWESFQEEVNYCEEALDRLHRFDYASLDERNRIEYEAYEFYLETKRDINSYPQFSGYFEPSSGIHENIISDFTEFIFYRTEDVEDYLTILADLGRYFADALDVTKRQAEGGYFMTNDQLDKTKESIAGFAAKREDNPLIVIFDENMDALSWLSAEEKASYKAKNRDIVLNSVLPAYENTAKELEALRGSRSIDGPVSAFPNGGAEYYKAVIRLKTSSDDSIDAQITLLKKFLMRLIDEYIELQYESRDANQKFQSETVSVKTPDEILAYLQNHLNDYPEGPEVTYKSSYLDPSVAKNSSVAYYMRPPVDALQDNVIRINGDNVSDENDLYETLAHEGFPGHLYQFTWDIANIPSVLNNRLTFLGYSEGWGMYSEMVAWDFSGLSEEAIKLHKIYTALSYAEDAVADLGVNGLGWQVNDLARFLDSIGLNPELAESFYDYVTTYPGMMLPYGTGLARYQNMRQEAEETLGENFVLKEFHTILLKDGQVPFTIVDRQFKAYLASAGKGDTKPETTPAPSPTPSTPAPTERPREPGPDIAADHTTNVIMLGVFAALALCMGILLFVRRRKDPFA